MSQHFGVVTDLLEASASLAGLALVFLGMIASATAAQEPRETLALLKQRSRPVYATLSAFVAGVLCVAVAAVWLVGGQSRPLYTAVVVLFFVQLASLLIATSWSIRQLLRTG